MPVPYFYFKTSIQFKFCIKSACVYYEKHKVIKTISMHEKRLHHTEHSSCSTCSVLPGPNVWIFMCKITFKHMALIDRLINLSHFLCKNKWQGQRQVRLYKKPLFLHPICVVWVNTIFVQCIFKFYISHLDGKKEWQSALLVV